MAEAVARLMELSADEKARMRADAREKWLWDQAARKRQYLKEGRAEGEAIGLAKGETIGLAKGKADIARRMLRMKMPLSDIAGATGLSEMEITRLT